VATGLSSTPSIDDIHTKSSNMKLLNDIPTTLLLAVALASVSYGLLDLDRSEAFAQTVTLTGTWRHAGDAAEQTRRHAEIDRVTESIGRLMRGGARERLRDMTSPAPEMTLSDEGERVTIVARDHRVTIATNGTPTRVTGAQDAGTMRAQRRDGRLVVTAEGDNGVRTTVYRLSEDGRRLVLDVRLESERLSEPLRYRVAYVRR
jgi:hypothetical protein